MTPDFFSVSLKKQSEGVGYRKVTNKIKCPSEETQKTQIKRCALTKKE